MKSDFIYLFIYLFLDSNVINRFLSSEECRLQELGIVLVYHVQILMWIILYVRRVLLGNLALVR